MHGVDTPGDATFLSVSEAKLLYTSTSEVYGQAGCFSEEEPKIVSSKISSRSEYAVSKILAEIVMINRNKVSPFKFNIIRPFNIIGPRQSSKGGFVLPRFLESAYGEKSLSVFGSGSQIRAFTYIEDIVNALTMVMESDIEGEVFNIGNERNITTIKNLADIVKEETHARSEIIYVNPKEVYGALYEEAYDKLPNSSKIKKMLGWEPKYDLREAVQKTWGYFLKMTLKKPSKTLNIKKHGRSRPEMSISIPLLR